MPRNFLGLDTETCNSLIDENGKLDLSQSLVYDVGWQVVNRKGKVKKQRSYVVAEIFLNSILMDSAYYKDKIPMYWKDIKKGKRELKTFRNIWFQFLSDKKRYNCKVVFAHNAFFDYNALNNTLRYLTKSKRRYFFPFKTEIWDTLKMARDVFGTSPKYVNFCEEHGFMTNHKNPRPRLTAEVLYRYLHNTPNFEEAHTGLEDVEIETEIMLRCLKSRKPMRKTLFKK
jgi:DNA polymerase III epsilon subunit-like protein